MIKSQRQNKPLGNKYPWIGISNINIIILFTSPKCGVVLNQDKCKLDIYRIVGRYSEHINEEDFTIYNGIITLSN